MSVAGDFPNGQVWAISGPFRPLHGPRWSKLSFKHPFYIGNQCCLINICPKIDIWGCSWSRWPRLGHFWPFVAPYMVYDGPNRASSIHFVLWINVALSIFVLKSISEAEGAPDGQVWAISGHVHGRRWYRLTFKHPFHIENQCCFKKIVLKSLSEAGGAPDGQVLAIVDPHMVRYGHHQKVKWSDLNFAATFIKKVVL